MAFIGPAGPWPRLSLSARGHRAPAPGGSPRATRRRVRGDTSPGGRRGESVRSGCSPMEDEGRRANDRAAASASLAEASNRLRGDAEARLSTREPQRRRACPVAVVQSSQKAARPARQAVASRRRPRPITQVDPARVQRGKGASELLRQQHDGGVVGGWYTSELPFPDGGRQPALG